MTANGKKARSAGQFKEERLFHVMKTTFQVFIWFCQDGCALKLVTEGGTKLFQSKKSSGIILLMSLIPVWIASMIMLFKYRKRNLVIHVPVNIVFISLPTSG